MSLKFDEAKATEAAALFLALRGGRMSYLKLIKLLYLADREALSRWGIPITTDRYVSMDHGPVVSNIYNLIVEDRQKPFWSEYISAPLGDYEVELKREAPTERLSRAEEKLIAEIFEQHGYKRRWELVDEVHKLPEWNNPQGSSSPISVADILRAVGTQEEEISAITNELNGVASADRKFTRRSSAQLRRAKEMC